MPFGAPVARVLTLSLGTLELLGAPLVVGCGEESTEPAPFDPTVLDIVELKGFPHEIDIYAVKRAPRAIVVLHGIGGYNYGVGKSLGLHDSNRPPTGEHIDWDWLLEHDVTVALPQGQALPDQPSMRTWSSRVMDSGVNDIAFLEALSLYLRTDLGVREVYLFGHSSGGMQVHRVYCEAAESFDGYISVAGAASNYYAAATTPCRPSRLQPYLGIVGEKDSLLGVQGYWSADSWTINPNVADTNDPAWLDPTLVGEWNNYEARVESMCREIPSLDAAETTGEAVERWSHCDGRMELQRVYSGTHKLETIESAAGYRVFDEVMRFVEALGDARAESAAAE